MYSSLQAELRFTQILTLTCRNCAQRQPRKPRSFHTVSRLRAPQNPSNIGSVSGRGISEETKNNASCSEIAKEKAEQEEKRPSDSQPPTGPGDSTASKNVEEAPAQSFYGSPVKRRMRSRLNQQATTELAPGWFMLDISLWGEEKLAQGAPSKIHLAAADLITGELLEHNLPSNSSGPPSSRAPKDENGDSLSIQTQPLDEEESADTIISGSDNPKRYYVLDEQFGEAERIARGLMQISQKKDRPDVNGSWGDHLHLQYADKDGELLLDHVVEDLARKLGCDLTVLDAHDIADFIHQFHPRQFTAKAGRMLSYDALTNRLPEPASRASAQLPQEAEDDDEDLTEESGAPAIAPLSAFFGKPIAIDLRMFEQLPEEGDDLRSDRHQTSLRVLRDSWNPVRPHVGFAGIVRTLLKSMAERRKTLKQSEQELTNSPAAYDKMREDAAKQTGVPKDAVIIHVKDLKAIRTINVGNEFLRELYDQVETRRSKGECILLVGTDSIRADQGPFTQEGIDKSQNVEHDPTSQSIVLTPVLPNTTSKLALLHDRKRRIATINMRHLWAMMRGRKPLVFAHLKPGFWRRDFFDQLSPSDKSCLETRIWNYRDVQRLAAYIAGAAPERRKDSSNADKEGPSESSIGPSTKLGPVISAAIAHLNLSDKTKLRWVEKQFKETKSEASDRDAPKEDLFDKIRMSASKYEKRLMSGIIEAKNITTTFNDVHMPVEMINTLQTLTTLSLQRPDAFKYGVLASDKIPGLLLYGPPGTGKTLAAKAVAKESGATMLEISAADINDMYVGESEKIVKALFSLARKLSPCVVFIDEADAMFSTRNTHTRRASHREVLNQFLKEWDGMSKDSGSAFIMVATNRPMDLDDAVLRRLPRRLLVDLPTETDRLEILKIHLRNENLAEDVDLPTLAKDTPFYSGSDLKNVAVAAALNCVQEENEQAKNYKGEEPYQHPERRTLRAHHFQRALEDISASISEDMSSLREIKKFDEQFGDKRGKKKKGPKLGFPTQKSDAARDTVKVRELN